MFVIFYNLKELPISFRDGPSRMCLSSGSIWWEITWDQLMWYIDVNKHIFRCILVNAIGTREEALFLGAPVELQVIDLQHAAPSVTYFPTLTQFATSIDAPSPPCQPSYDVIAYPDRIRLSTFLISWYREDIGWRGLRWSAEIWIKWRIVMKLRNPIKFPQQQGERLTCLNQAYEN